MREGFPPAAHGSFCPLGRPTPPPVCPSALPQYQQDMASGPEPGLPARPWAAPHWPWVLSVMRLAPGTPLPLTLTLQRSAFCLCTFILQVLFPDLLISPPQRPSSERPSHPPAPPGSQDSVLDPLRLFLMPFGAGSGHHHQLGDPQHCPAPSQALSWPWT